MLRVSDSKLIFWYGDVLGRQVEHVLLVHMLQLGDSLAAS